MTDKKPDLSKVRLVEACGGRVMSKAEAQAEQETAFEA
jgi:hypothetical protein